MMMGSDVGWVAGARIATEDEVVTSKVNMCFNACVPRWVVSEHFINSVAAARC
jgi:hypothetical protein